MSLPSDFQAFFAVSPHPYLAVAPDAPRFTITEVNEAYLRVTRRTREDLIGTPLFQAFPDNPGNPTADGVTNLRASLERVLRSRDADVMAVQRYDVRQGNGSFEERHWSPTNTPVLDRAGAVSAILHHVEDVTAKVALERREAFRQDLGAKLHEMAEPREMMDAACAALGRHLGVAQVGFGEVGASQEFSTVERDWNDGRSPSVAGRWRMDDFGPQFIREMKAGATIIIPDITQDPRTNAPEVVEAYDRIGTRAILNVPLIRDGQMMALLFILHPAPRAWSPEEVGLVEETCGRLWSAVERARSDRRLRESEALARDRLAELEQIYRYAPVGLFTFDREYRFTRINERMAEINGFPVEAHLGRDMWQIVPDLADHLVEVYRPVFERGEPVLEVELHGETPAHPGVPRDWLASYFPLRSGEGETVGLIGAVLEVTDRKRAEDSLRDSESRFRSLAEGIHEVFYVRELDEGRISYISPAFLPIWRRSPEEGVADPSCILAAVHPDDRHILQQVVVRHEAGESSRVEYRLLHEDGHIRYISDDSYVTTNPLTGARRVVGIAEDITEQRLAEQRLLDSEAKLRELNGELERRVALRTASLQDTARVLEAEMARREEAQSRLAQAEKLEALGQVVGGVAHDFNNVLTAIQGAFILLERRVLDERLLPMITEGRKAADRAAALVQQMLAFARRQPARFQVVEPSRLLPDLDGVLRHTLSARTVLRLNVDGDLWPVLIDPHQLEVALLNLAVNARDAMTEGGEVVLRARNQPADPSHPDEFAAGDRVAISVSDTGTGMDETTLARAFEPFFTTKEPGKGTGLGLAQVHGVVQACGGEVRVESVLGQGTTVSLLLPRSALRARAEAEAPGMLADLHGQATILLVDDDDQVRPVTAALLRDLGYTVVEAPSAAVAQAMAQLHPIDLLLTDVVMPVTDGPTLARALRAERPDLPVLFITGYAADHILEGEDVIAKPFTENGLERQVLRALRRPVDGKSS